jgi:tetratricopeptide (TPR) repeat protein
LKYDISENPKLNHEYADFLSFINDEYEAVKQYEIALKIAPESRKTRQRQIAILYNRGLHADAIDHLRILLEQNPKDLNACTQLGDLYLQTGDYQQSLRFRKQAYEMAPERVDNLNNLAWLLATTPYPNDRDEKKALQLAESAATATEYKSAGVLDTLAAARAATGNFIQAVEDQEKAIALAPEQEQVRFKQRLNLYRQQKPYRLAENPNGASQ